MQPNSIFNSYESLPASHNLQLNNSIGQNVISSVQTTNSEEEKPPGKNNKMIDVSNIVANLSQNETPELNIVKENKSS